jgi:hypothetical protein
VKPPHYDDDGDVIQWLRSPIPSNSLELFGSDAARAFVERQRHMTNVRERAAGG